MGKVLFCVFILARQMNTLQDKPVVRLPMHQNSIPRDFDGDLIEVKDPPPTVQLPQLSSFLNSRGSPWAVDIRNLGPGTMIIVGRTQFSLQVNVGQTVHIKATKVGFTSTR